MEDDLRVAVAGDGGVEGGGVSEVDALEGEAALTAEPLEVAVRTAAGEVVEDRVLPSCARSLVAGRSDARGSVAAV